MLTFEKELVFETMSSVYLSKIKQYWESKGFKLTTVGSNLITGKRGSTLQNNFVFDMMKVKSRLTIQIHDYSVHAKVEVDPIGQVLTEAEKQYWPLEMEAFKQFVLYNKTMEEDFKEYYKGAKKAVLKIYIVILLIAALFGLYLGYLYLR